MPTYVFHYTDSKTKKPMRALRHLHFLHRESVRLIHSVIELAKQRFLDSTDQKYNYIFSFMVCSRDQWRLVDFNGNKLINGSMEKGIDDPVWKALRKDICLTNHITQEQLILTNDTRGSAL
ncbi:hypothetical protein Ddc_02448 [Ditylenchus destructor]|nr:hypothetical protein Ddc_02448 [Ditylenchus destructor]